jgi:IS1 family transposase
MNRLSTERRAQVLAALVEGNSIRATVRMTGVAKNTITKLLADVGFAATDFQDKAFKDLPCETFECDEIWAYCYSKQKNVPEQHKGTFGYGDVWTWTAICADTKLVPSWLVGERTAWDAYAFMNDLARRVNHRVQITTDGLNIYIPATRRAFKDRVDFAMLQKIYGDSSEPEKRYSPAVCIGTETEIIKGNPDPAKISTSYVERQNLTMRMGMRRFTRLTNGFSKKIENLAWAVSLHFMHYNFARPHKTLTKKYPTTPAMAAGVADHVWTVQDIAELLEPQESSAAA